MDQPIPSAEYIAMLEKDLAAQKKIIKVLMERVERSVNDTGGAYSLFERNITLQRSVEARTRELDKINRELHRLIDEANRAQEAAEQANRSKGIFLDKLKGFFSSHLADLIMAGGAEDPLKSHRREVTVVFVDLRGFTPFSETSEPEEVMGVLNEYHTEMGKQILAYEATLEHFAGDGIMVFFNDPVPVPNPEERAIRMALAMRDRMSTLTDKWRKQGVDLGLGVGIAKGHATLGAIGFEGRWQYGAIGTVANLASRLCDEAKHGQILISRRALATVEELVEVEPVAELTLKGFHRPVTTYNVLRLKA